MLGWLWCNPLRNQSTYEVATGLILRDANWAVTGNRGFGLTIHSAVVGWVGVVANVLWVVMLAALKRQIGSAEQLLLTHRDLVWMHEAPFGPSMGLRFGLSVRSRFRTPNQRSDRSALRPSPACIHLLSVSYTHLTLPTTPYV